jgi:hypothetical protein
MTKQDFLDYLVKHGCELIPTKEHEPLVIFILNPHNRQEAFLDLPIDNRQLRDYTILRICTKLCVPVPDQMRYLSDLDDRINDRLGRN